MIGEPTLVLLENVILGFIRQASRKVRLLRTRVTSFRRFRLVQRSVSVHARV